MNCRRGFSPKALTNDRDELARLFWDRRTSFPAVVSWIVHLEAVATFWGERPLRSYLCNNAHSFGRNRKHPIKTEMAAATRTAAAPTSFAVRASGWIC
jgi:hypothetical protein